MPSGGGDENPDGLRAGRKGGRRPRAGYLSRTASSGDDALLLDVRATQDDLKREVEDLWSEVARERPAGKPERRCEHCESRDEEVKTLQVLLKGAAMKERKKAAAEFQQQKEDLAAVVKDATEGKGALRAEARASAAACEKLEKESKDAHDALAKATGQLAEAYSKIRSTESRNAELAKELSGLQKSAVSTAKLQARLTDAESALNAARAQSNDSTATLKAKVRDLEAKLSASDGAYHKAAAAAETATGKLHRTMSEFVKLERNQESAESEARRYKAAAEKLRSTNSALEARLNETLKETNRITERAVLQTEAMEAALERAESRVIDADALADQRLKDKQASDSLAAHLRAQLSEADASLRAATRQSASLTDRAVAADRQAVKAVCDLADTRHYAKALEASERSLRARLDAAEAAAAAREDEAAAAGKRCLSLKTDLLRAQKSGLRLQRELDEAHAAIESLRAGMDARTEGQAAAVAAAEQRGKDAVRRTLLPAALDCVARGVCRGLLSRAYTRLLRKSEAAGVHRRHSQRAGAARAERDRLARRAEHARGGAAAALCRAACLLLLSRPFGRWARLPAARAGAAVRTQLGASHRRADGAEARLAAAEARALAAEGALAGAEHRREAAERACAGLRAGLRDATYQAGLERASAARWAGKREAAVDRWAGLAARLARLGGAYRGWAAVTRGKTAARLREAARRAEDQLAAAVRSRDREREIRVAAETQVTVSGLLRARVQEADAAHAALTASFAAVHNRAQAYSRSSAACLAKLTVFAAAARGYHTLRRHAGRRRAKRAAAAAAAAEERHAAAARRAADEKLAAARAADAACAEARRDRVELARLRAADAGREEAGALAAALAAESERAAAEAADLAAEAARRGEELASVQCLLEAKEDELIATVGCLNEERAEHSDAVAALEARVASLAAEAARQGEELASVQCLLEAKEDELIATVGCLNGERAEHSALDARVASLAADRATSQADAARLAAEAARRGEELASVQRLLEAKEDELLATVNRLNGERAEHSDAIAALEARVASLAADHATLQADAARLAAEVASLASAKHDAERLQRELNIAEGELTELRRCAAEVGERVLARGKARHAAAAAVAAAAARRLALGCYRKLLAHLRGARIRRGLPAQAVRAAGLLLRRRFEALRGHAAAARLRSRRAAAAAALAAAPAARLVARAYRRWLLSAASAVSERRLDSLRGSAAAAERALAEARRLHAVARADAAAFLNDLAAAAADKAAAAAAAAERDAAAKRAIDERDARLRSLGEQLHEGTVRLANSEAGRARERSAAREADARLRRADAEAAELRSRLSAAGSELDETRYNGTLAAARAETRRAAAKRREQAAKCGALAAATARLLLRSAYSWLHAWRALAAGRRADAVAPPCEVQAARGPPSFLPAVAVVLARGCEAPVRARWYAALSARAAVRRERRRAARELAGCMSGQARCRLLRAGFRALAASRLAARVGRARSAAAGALHAANAREALRRGFHSLRVHAAASGRAAAARRLQGAREATQVRAAAALAATHRHLLVHRRYARLAALAAARPRRAAAAKAAAFAAYADRRWRAAGYLAPCFGKLRIHALLRAHTSEQKTAETLRRTVAELSRIQADAESRALSLEAEAGELKRAVAALEQAERAKDGAAAVQAATLKEVRAALSEERGGLAECRRAAAAADVAAAAARKEAGRLSSDLERSTNLLAAARAESAGHFDAERRFESLAAAAAKENKDLASQVAELEAALRRSRDAAEGVARLQADAAAAGEKLAAAEAERRAALDELHETREALDSAQAAAERDAYARSVEATADAQREGRRKAEIHRRRAAALESRTAAATLARCWAALAAGRAVGAAKLRLEQRSARGRAAAAAALAAAARRLAAGERFARWRGFAVERRKSKEYDTLTEGTAVQHTRLLGSANAAKADARRALAARLGSERTQSTVVRYYQSWRCFVAAERRRSRLQAAALRLEARARRALLAAGFAKLAANRARRRLRARRAAAAEHLRRRGAVRAASAVYHAWRVHATAGRAAREVADGLERLHAADDAHAHARQTAEAAARDLEAAHRSETERLKGEVAAGAGEIKKCREHIKELADAAAASQAVRTRAETDLEARDAALADARGDRDAAKARVKRLQAALDAQSKEAAASLSSQAAALARSEADLDGTRAELSRVRGQLDEAERERDAHASENARKRHKIESLCEQLKAAERGLREAVDREQRHAARHKAAVEQLRSDHQQLSDKAAAGARELCDQLNTTQKNLNATTAELDGVCQSEAALSEKLCRVTSETAQTAQYLETCLADAMRRGHALEKEVAALQEVSGGFSRTSDAQQARIREAEARCEAMAATVRGNEAAIDALEARQHDQTVANAGLAAKVGGLESKCAAVEKELELARVELEDAMEHSEAAREELDAARASETALKEKAARLEQRRDVLGRELAAVVERERAARTASAETVRELREALAELEEELADRALEADASRATTESLTAKLRAAAEEVARKNRTIDELENQVRFQTNDFATKISVISRTAQQAEAEFLAVQTAGSAMEAELQERLAALDEQLQHLERQNHVLRESERDTRDELTAVKARRVASFQTRPVVTPLELPVNRNTSCTLSPLAAHKEWSDNRGFASDDDEDNNSFATRAGTTVRKLSPGQSGQSGRSGVLLGVGHDSPYARSSVLSRAVSESEFFEGAGKGKQLTEGSNPTDGASAGSFEVSVSGTDAGKSSPLTTLQLKLRRGVTEERESAGSPESADENMSSTDSQLSHHLVQRYEGNGSNPPGTAINLPHHPSTPDPQNGSSPSIPPSTGLRIRSYSGHMPYVHFVLPGSPADVAGILPGDHIVALRLPSVPRISPVTVQELQSRVQPLSFTLEAVDVAVTVIRSAAFAGLCAELHGAGRRLPCGETHADYFAGARDFVLHVKPRSFAHAGRTPRAAEIDAFIARAAVQTGVDADKPQLSLADVRKMSSAVFKEASLPPPADDQLARQFQEEGNEADAVHSALSRLLAAGLNSLHPTDEDTVL
ncbi:hypothetical protein DIPPA_16463 [Diplonema papillatum]|nr:hypothetical protein DIPPA_16463 [Diplonema papillatum]